MIGKYKSTVTHPSIRLSGGDLGNESITVRCDLSRADAFVEIDYCTGEGFVATQYNAAFCHHEPSGLVAAGKILAAQACEVPLSDFRCDVIF